jgi:hypothetical protein
MLLLGMPVTKASIDSFLNFSDLILLFIIAPRIKIVESFKSYYVNLIYHKCTLII